ncbi:MAG: phosphate signaling complex protein PhoU [Pseudomonadota bacterium]
MNDLGEHTVSAYDDELQGIVGKIVEMGGQAERILDQAVSALLKGDQALAQTAIAGDKLLNSLQRDVDEQAVLVITRRQPVAQDLRELIGAIRLSSDIERIGDLGKNIARRALQIDGSIKPQAAYGIEHLTDLASEQVKNVLDAYAERDVVRAQDVWKRDSEIDSVYMSLFRELLTYMMEDPRQISSCTSLLFCAKNVERIGDHATNIAETIYYIEEGEVYSPDADVPHHQRGGNV